MNDTPMRGQPHKRSSYQPRDPGNPEKGRVETAVPPSPEPPYRHKPIAEPKRGSYGMDGRGASVWDGPKGVDTSYREDVHVKFRDCGEGDE